MGNPKEDRRISSHEVIRFEAGNPSKCRQFCAPVEQTTHWRAFTQTSLDVFTRNGFSSTVSPREVSRKDDARDAYHTSTSALEVPGVLWTTPMLQLAFGMGMLRAITEKQPSYLMGVNHCRHDDIQGVEGFRVVQNGRKDKVLIPLEHDSGERNYITTAGTIFNKFSPQQIEDGVLYIFDQTFVNEVRDTYATDPYSGSREHNSIANLFTNVFADISADIGFPEDDHLVIDEFVQPYGAFLVPTHFPGLQTKTITIPSGTPTVYDVEALQHQFVNKMKEIRKTEKDTLH